MCLVLKFAEKKWGDFLVEVGVVLIAVSLHVPGWLKFVNVLEWGRNSEANHTLQAVPLP